MRFETSLFIAATVAFAAARPQDAPPKGKGLGGLGGPGGLLGLLGNIPGLPKPQPGDDMIASVCKTNGTAIETIFGSPWGKEPGEECMRDDSGGSGPYKANYTEDATLPDRTIYVPKTPPPATEKIPVIIWGNGMCLPVGLMFYNFLNEVASHGFMIIANGRWNETTVGSQTKYTDLLKSADWVMTNPAAKKYGNLDTSKLTVAGQSCGGGEAYRATAADPRFKLTVLFNSGGSNAETLAKFTNPIAYFLGGPKDMAQAKGDKDFSLLPANFPALKASIDVGHIGTYYQKNGGKIGKAASAFFKWQLKGDVSQKEMFCNPKANTELTKVGWQIESKGNICA